MTPETASVLGALGGATLVAGTAAWRRLTEWRRELHGLQEAIGNALDDWMGDET